jgi:hypothetical protein
LVVTHVPPAEPLPETDKSEVAPIHNVLRPSISAVEFPCTVISISFVELQPALLRYLTLRVPAAEAVTTPDDETLPTEDGVKVYVPPAELLLIKVVPPIHIWLGPFRLIVGGPCTVIGTLADLHPFAVFVKTTFALPAATPDIVPELTVKIEVFEEDQDPDVGFEVKTRVPPIHNVADATEIVG